MRLHTAANTLAPALAELHSMGFAVRHEDGAGYHYVAERQGVVLGADDVLQLLGLAILQERRGDAACRPTDAEVEDLLRLETPIP